MIKYMYYIHNSCIIYINHYFHPGISVSECTFTGIIVSTSLASALLFVYVPVSFISLLILCYKIRVKQKILNQLKSQESTSKTCSERKEPTMKVIDTKENLAYGLTVLVNNN